MKKIGYALAMSACSAVFVISASAAFATPPDHSNGKAVGLNRSEPVVASEGQGANTTGPYDPYGVGKPSGNGNGNGNAIGKPCAGCVGNADTKNPPGQLPGPQDGNKGYECDQNNGIGKTNPAHSGCAPAPPTTTTTVPPTTTTTVPPTTTTTVPSTTTTVPVVTTTTTKPGGSLPHTGAESMPLIGMGLSAAGIGGVLSALTRRKH